MNKDDFREEDIAELTANYKKIWEENVLWTHPYDPTLKLVSRLYTMHSSEKDAPEYLEDDIADFELVFQTTSQFGNPYEKKLALLPPTPLRGALSGVIIAAFISHLMNPSTCTSCLRTMIYASGGYVCKCDF